MPRRLPWTVWLHLSWDLWRLVLLTAGVLVTVIAFAAAVKPLADGKLGPVDTVKFMLLAMPPMLQYALPFAACFGATLAYHRWTADNEIIACHAGGISHRALLAPAIVAGLLLACILLSLSNFIIPRFLRHMEELVTRDAGKLIMHAIERGESIKLGDRLVYADRVVAQGPDPASGAFERLWLGGLLVVKLDKDGNVEEQTSAREASLWLRRVSGVGSGNGGGEGGGGDEGGDEGGGGGGRSMTEIVIRPRDAVFQGKAGRAAVSETIKPILVENTFTDDPKFLSFPELIGLREHPERIEGVQRRKHELALTLAQLECVEQVRRSLDERGAVELRDPEGRRVVVEAAGLRATRRRGAGGRVMRDPGTLHLVPAAGRRVTIEQVRADGTIRRQDAAGALLRVPQASNPAAASIVEAPGSGADHARVTLILDLINVSVREMDEQGELILPADESGGTGAPAVGAMSEWTLTGLTLVDDPARRLLAEPSGRLIELAEQRAGGRPAEREVVAAPLASLVNRITDLLREAVSKIHERVAMAAACLVMVVMGSVMAMRLRESLPLTIYLWAFFPALAAVITISAGQQLTHGHGLVGLPLLWGGVAALGGITGWEFIRLIRH